MTEGRKKNAWSRECDSHREHLQCKSNLVVAFDGNKDKS